MVLYSAVSSPLDRSKRFTEMDLRSISGRKNNKVYLNTYLNQYAHTYL